MTGIILAGGENSRMAANKAFLEIEGRPLIERTLDLFKGLFEDVIIVTNEPELYVEYDAMLVGDLLKKQGPMAGIYAGLLNSKNNYNFVAACDMPFLNRDLISFMMKVVNGADIVVPMLKGLPEPLHAIYTRSCLKVIEGYLKDDNRSVRNLLKGCNVKYVGEEDILKIDPEMRSFININTAEEFNKVMEKEV